jgi:hypothetical protein
MTPLDILAVIRSAGGRVVVDGDDLAVEVPAGVLTAEHKAALIEHKAVLLRLLTPDDPEREAIQWVEALAPTEADAVLRTALAEWDSLVSQDRDLDAYVKAHGFYPKDGIGVWRSRWDAVEPDPDVINARWEDGLDPVACEKCGSLLAWYDVGGRHHCQLCDPPIRWDMLRTMARRLRREAEKV